MAESNPEELTCVSMVLCDQVYRDERSKKLIVVGVFNQIIAEHLPALHPEAAVLFTLTNGRGTYELWLSMEHEASGQEVIRCGGPYRVDNPLRIVDVNITIPRLEFQASGKHWLTLRSDGRILQQRPFWVRITEDTEAHSRNSNVND